MMALSFCENVERGPGYPWAGRRRPIPDDGGCGLLACATGGHQDGRAVPYGCLAADLVALGHVDDQTALLDVLLALSAPPVLRRGWPGRR